MAPYLLLGFFIAGMLHVFVPQRFYANYLSQNNKFSVVNKAFAAGQSSFGSIGSVKKRCEHCFNRNDLRHILFHISTSCIIAFCFFVVPL